MECRPGSRRTVDGRCVAEPGCAARVHSPDIIDSITRSASSRGSESSTPPCRPPMGPRCFSAPPSPGSSSKFETMAVSCQRLPSPQVGAILAPSAPALGDDLRLRRRSPGQPAPLCGPSRGPPFENRSNSQKPPGRQLRASNAAQAEPPKPSLPSRAAQAEQPKPSRPTSTRLASAVERRHCAWGRMPEHPGVASRCCDRPFRLC